MRLPVLCILAVENGVVAVTKEIGTAVRARVEGCCHSLLFFM